MRSEFKLIFDECLSHLMMGTLRPFLERSGCHVELKGIVEFYKAGTPDSEWIPRIAAESGWLILSTDRGRSRNEKPEERLPFLCRKHSVTHVLFAPSVHDLTGFEKGQAIVAVWDEFDKVKEATPGTRFTIQFNKSRTQFLLVNFDERMAAENEKRKLKRAKSAK